ncbi:MAG: hypothetical protein WBW41_08525 [Verrucomicrobiia bacterium]
MKNGFVADGPLRLGLQEKKEALRKSIQARHAGELAGANWFQKRRIRYKIWREFQGEWKQIKPSAYTLYSAQTKI